MSTWGERRKRATEQRARRLSRRRCGHCGEAAERMIEWSGQLIPICLSCIARLNAVPAEPFCALNELGSRYSLPEPVEEKEPRSLLGRFGKWLTS